MKGGVRHDQLHIRGLTHVLRKAIDNLPCFCYAFFDIHSFRQKRTFNFGKGRLIIWKSWLNTVWETWR